MAPTPNEAVVKLSTPPAPSTPVVEEESLESLSLTDEARRSLKEEDFKTLQKIAVNVGKDGMTLEEACVLANVDYENLKAQAIKFPVILKIVRMKELEYKKMLLKTISQKARSGDDKLALWLLERRHPEEYGGGKRGNGGGDGGGQDLLGMAIDFIQSAGDKEPIVRKQLRVGVVKKSTPHIKNSEAKKLQGFLI